MKPPNFSVFPTIEYIIGIDRLGNSKNYHITLEIISYYIWTKQVKIIGTFPPTFFFFKKEGLL